MGERGHDADWITRWVIRKYYRISKPSPDQIARYRYWHHVSRTVTFDASGPWECWLSREIPPGATVPEPSLPPPPAPPETICSDSEQTPETAGEVFTGSDSEPVKSPPPRQRGRRSARAEKVCAEVRADEAGEAAERLLRRRLAQAPRPYSTIESEARAVGIPVDVLLVTANALGVKGREVGNGNPLRIGNERRERAQGDHKNPPPFWLRRNRLHG